MLRSGGTAIIAVPFVWEYDRTILEHRFTGPELETLEGWDAVAIVENGGQAVAWATLTGVMMERSLGDPVALARPIRTGRLSAAYLVNGCGSLLDALEQRHSSGPHTLPMNLLVRARRPAEA